MPKMPKVSTSDDLEQRVDAARKEQQAKEQKRQEEKAKKEKAQREESMLKQTRGSWMDFQRCGKMKRGKMPGVKKET